MTKPVLAFDVYGTLIDIDAIEEPLAQWTKDAVSFSRLWRAKQLEYAFRYALMDHYVSFAECTRQALDYTAAYYDVALNEKDKEELMAVYVTLPVFEDVKPALNQLQEKGYPLFAFSNGTSAAVKTLLEGADILHYFRKVVSVEDVASFKPAPIVYRHLLEQTGGNVASATNTYLISANSFDVLGAMFFGMKAGWIRRKPKMVFDNWGKTPTLVLSSLEDLPRSLESQR